MRLSCLAQTSWSCGFPHWWSWSSWSCLSLCQLLVRLWILTLLFLDIYFRNYLSHLSWCQDDICEILSHHILIMCTDEFIHSLLDMVFDFHYHVIYLLFFFHMILKKTIDRRFISLKSISNFSEVWVPFCVWKRWVSIVNMFLGSDWWCETAGSRSGWFSSHSWASWTLHPKFGWLWRLFWIRTFWTWPIHSTLLIWPHPLLKGTHDLLVLQRQLTISWTSMIRLRSNITRSLSRISIRDQVLPSIQNFIRGNHSINHMLKIHFGSLFILFNGFLLSLDWLLNFENGFWIVFWIPFQG